MHSMLKRFFEVPGLRTAFTQDVWSNPLSLTSRVAENCEVRAALIGDDDVISTRLTALTSRMSGLSAFAVTSEGCGVSCESVTELFD